MLSWENMESKVNACLSLLEKGCTVREVCRVLKMSSKTVSSIVKGSFTPGKCGRPLCLAKEHVDFIEANSMSNARLTDWQIAEMTKKNLASRCLERQFVESGNAWGSSTALRESCRT